MRRPFDLPQLSTFSAAMNASCGMSTLPNCRILLPSSPEVPAEHMRCDDGVVPLIFRYLDVCFATKATWLLRSSDMTRWARFGPHNAQAQTAGPPPGSERHGVRSSCPAQALFRPGG